MPISATRSTNFRPLNGDQDGDNFVDVGDILRHTLTITNTGTQANGVVVNDTLFGSTETGLINISPIAFHDAFTAVGNTVLRVGGAANNGTGPSSQVAGNLLSNDVGNLSADDIPGFQLDTQSNVLTNGGGRVNVFSDGSFNYVSEAGDTGSDFFTYTIRDAGFDNVYNTADDLISIGRVDITLSGQVWYVDSAAAPGTGTGTSNDPFGTLTSVQAVDSAGDYVYVKGNAVPGTLVMEANELLIGSGEALVVSGFNLATAGANSIINNSGSGLTLSTDNTIKGVTINNTDVNAVGIQDGGGSVGTLTIDTVSISGTGKAIDIDAGGTLAVDIDSLSSSSSATQGVHLQGVTGSFNATGGHIQTSGQQGFLIGAAGGVTASSGGTATITYGGAISSSTGSNVEIQDRTGGTVTFSGNITDGAIAAGGSGILLDGNSGTVNFTGQVFLTAGATTGQGVVIGANAATVNFNATGTGLDISTTSGAGFTAAGGGTVNVTGTANTIASTSATALSVSGTTIGSSGLNFFSINAGNNTAAADAVNGIVLANTGNLGGLTVTGDGAAANNGTGGTIQNTTGDGISLTNTMNVVLGRMNITGVDGMGINGNGVYGIVLTRLNISGSGDSAAADEGGIRILELTGDASHVTQFNNISVTNSFEHNVFIRNTGGTLSNLVVANSTFSNNGASTQAGMHFIFEANTGGLGGTPTMTAHFTGNTFTGSTTVGQLTSHALQAAANEGLLTIFIGDGTIAGRNTFTTNAVGIDLDTSGTGNLNFNVNNNILTDTTSNAINIFRGASSTGTVNGYVTNNVIGTQGVATSGSEQGAGVRVGSEGGGVTRLLIDSNIIQSIGVSGVSGSGNIELTQGIAAPPGGYVEGTLHATITNNTLRDNADDRAMNATARNGTINLDFHGNTLSGITGTSGTFVRLSAASLNPSDDGLFNVPQASLAAIAAANTGLTSGQISSNGTINFNQAVPQMPTAFLFVEAPGPLVEDEPGIGKGEATGGDFVTPGDAPDPGAPSGQPIVIDDGVVSQAELDLIVEAAIQRWADAGATAEQLEAMRSTVVTVANLQGLQLGTSAAGEIVIDHNAAGFNWFIDATPGDDSEFTGDGTRLAATPNTVAAIRVDLLTTVMHELGHQIGLGDSYASGDSEELMFGSIMAGERRLPGADDAAQGDGTHVTGTAFALTAISLGNIPANQTVIVQWESTATGYNTQIVPTLTNFSTLTGTNPGAFSVNSNNEVLSPTSAPIALDSLTLGGTVWNDNGAGVGGIAFNGLKDGTEPGHDGVLVSLFADANNDNVADTPGTALATTTTSGGGNYTFNNLAPGFYIVRIDADNFDSGGNTSLLGRVTTVNNPDPDNNTDNDDNGYQSGGVGSAVFSNAIELAHDTEPTQDASLKFDVNTTLDFGFVYLNQAPINAVPLATQTFNEDGSVTFNTANGNLISVSDVDAAPGQIVVTLSIADGVLTPMAGSGATIGGTPNNLTITGTLTQVNAALNGLVYTPAADANGARTLTVNSNDQGNTGVDPGTTGGANDEQDTDQISISITAVADVVNDSLTIAEDAGASNVAVLANDTFEGSAETITLFSQGTNGTVTLNDQGNADPTDDSLVYTPNADFNGSDSFTYTVTSGGVTEQGTVNVTVTAVADAVNDTLNIAEDAGASNVAVLANDTFEGSAETITLFSQGTNGTVTLNDQGNADPTDDSLVYTPNADYYGSDSFTYTVSSGGVTEVATVNVTVSAVADIVDDSVTVNEDSGANTLDLLLNDNFEDSGRSITAVTQGVNGGVVTIDDNDTVGDTTDDFVTYAPAAGYSGPDSFTYTVSSGGVSETATVTVGVTAVNDAPTFSSAAPQPSYTENGAPVVIAANVTVADDQANFAGGSYTVAVTSGATPGDALGVTTSSTPGVGIEISGSDYYYNGQLFGSVTGGGPTSLVLGLTANATPAAIDALTEAFFALSISEYPTSTPRVVTFTLVDGGGGLDTTSFTRTISVTPINDQPVVTVASPLAVDEQVAEAIAPTGTLADLDLDTRNAGNGDYAGSTLTIEVNGGASAQDVLSLVNGAGFTVNGGNLENGLSQVFGTVSGGSGAPLVIAFTGSGLATSALADAVLQAVQYVYNGDSPPGTITLDLTMNDGAPANADQGAVGSNPATGTASIIVNITDTAENAAPVIANLGGDNPTFTEGDAAAVLLDTGTAALVTDADSPANFNGGSLTVSITVNETAGEDVLGISTAGTITLSDGTNVNSVVSVGGLAVGTITANGTGGNDLVVTFDTTDATPANVTTLVQGLTYFNSNTVEPSALPRTISVSVSDGLGGTGSQNVSVTVVEINDSPTLTAIATNPTFTEDGAAVDLFGTVAADTVEPSQSFTAMTLTVTNVTDGASEILFFDGFDVALTHNNNVVTTNGSVLVTLSGTTATLAFTSAGATEAQVQTLIDGLTYRNTSQNPTDGDRAIAIVTLVDSGSGTSPSDNDVAPGLVSTVNVNPVNDAASITGTATGVVVEAGGVDNGSAGTPSVSHDLDSTDVDNPNDSWQTASGAATIGGYGTYAVTAAGVWTYTLNNNNATVQALNGAATLQDTFNVTTVGGTAQLVTITINAANDTANVRNDSRTTDEATAISGSVFVDNGSGADVDVDDPLVVASVGGGTVGTEFALPSGALLTLNSDGTFDYDPNGAFDTTAANGSGAPNAPSLDQFTYTLASGGGATVFITVNGIDNDDILLGTPGDDVFNSGQGADYLSGADGNDYLEGGIGHDSADGGAGDDILFGGDGDDELIGGADDDYLNGGIGVDYLDGGLGHDAAEGGAGNDILFGGDGSDNLLGGDDNDYLDGGLDIDFLDGGLGSDVIGGGAGDDILFGGDGNDVLHGGGDNDYINGGIGADFADGGAGNDAFEGGNGNDIAFGGTGSDNLIGGDGDDYLNGGDGIDYLEGGIGNDWLEGGINNDILLGGGDNDTIIAGDGADHIEGGDGVDLVFAEGGADIILGGIGADYLDGGIGDDYIEGGGGDDGLAGGAGNDILVGGSGADVFHFATALGAGNIDAISDMTAGTDKIALSEAIFHLGIGDLDESAFQVGSEASGDGVRIVYDSTTGALYFDSDGGGGGAMVQFASLSAGLSLTASDFIVY